ncbi:p-hydroxybenzoic acid efflux pump subunit AaeA [BD1-7 clade bacterium]|uniref:p-hydroxybenzoic acid efflux pump subunit AaeA n=1 Tax=BD1-7 clade bacterium TaxID=2029982 RepID=A0A5S9QM90_9GAMM|nr:p-hydroxybenzoic acid efflux pump subunit AaeA [BD1-7 clade bacterium]
MLAPWTRDGRLRAEIAEISAEIKGNIVALHVTNNQYVKQGDVLLEIDPSDYTIAKELATAQLKAAQVKLEQLKEEAERRDNIPKGLITVEDRRNANLAFAAQRATVAAATAMLQKAELDLSRTQIHAPSDGYVTNMHLRIGTYLDAGDRTLAFIDKRSFYVVGYFQENRIYGLQPNTPVKVSFLGDNRIFGAHVVSVGRGIADTNQNASSQLLPDVQQTFPWVRLAQRIPVRVEFDTAPPAELLVAGRTCTVIAKPANNQHQSALGVLDDLK